MRRVLVYLCLVSLPAGAVELEGPEALRPSPQWMPAPIHDRPAGRRWGVFSAGVSLFLVGYVADIGVTYGFNHANAEMAFIPIVGPLVQLGDSYQIADPKMVQTGNASVDQKASSMINTGNQAYQSVIQAGLVIDAALQLAGVVTAIAGASMKGHRSPQVLSSNGRAALSITF